jgi:hypothetical protein
MKKILPYILVACISVAASASVVKELADKEILALAMSPYDKSEKMLTEEKLGFHKGNELIVIYPCGDICPHYTKRVIHYKVKIEKCAESGGIVKEIRVVRGRGSNEEPFCFPKVIAENWNDIVF